MSGTERLHVICMAGVGMSGLLDLNVRCRVGGDLALAIEALVQGGVSSMAIIPILDQISGGRSRRRKGC